MRKTLLLTFIAVSAMFVVSLAQVQEAWIESDVGDFFDETENPALVLDKNENIIVGINTRVPDFDSEVLSDQLSSFHLSKFKPDGTKVFEILASVSSAAQKNLVGIAVDGSGNIYCAVHVWRVADAVTPRLAGIFAVYKYSPNGDLLWVRNYGDGESNFPRAIAVDAAGNVYLTGGCKESGLVQNNQVADYLTVKWNSNGDLQWAKRYDAASPGEGFNVAQDVVVDGSGNVYITGFSQRDGELGYGTIKYNSAGTELWAQRYTGMGSDNDIASAITIDINGFIYVTGESEGAIATVKYNNDGAQLWVQRKGSSGATARDVKVDPFGGVYVLGNSSSSQAALIKYRSIDGVELWTSSKYGAFHAMALDTDGNIFVSGTESGKGLTEKLNSSGVSQWFKTYESVGNPGVNKPIAVFTGNENFYTLNFFWRNCPGCGTPRYVAQLIKYTQCFINIPSSVRVNTEPGLCGATVSLAATVSGDCGAIEYQNISGEIAYTPGQFLDAGHYHLKAVSPSTGESKAFTIYVDDNEPPLLTNCPPNKTVGTDPGVCYASAASVDAGEATATDNCTVTVKGTRSDGLSLTDHYPVGETIITWIATDRFGNQVSCTQIITVTDTEAPAITGALASTYVLWPANHVMHDVTINYSVSDNCDVTASISVTSNEPVNGVADGDTDPDWEIINNHQVRLRAERSAFGNGRIYTITITAVDPAGNTSTQNIEVKVPFNIRNPLSGKPFKVGSTVNFEGEFWDVPGNKHTAKWTIDGSTSVKGAVTEPAGNKNGKVTGSYKFTSPGIYKLQMEITDQNGYTTYTNTAGDLDAIVVIYDPNGGHTYGGGHFNSPAGALLTNPAVTGKASYGFAMNYFKNSTNPKGETQFEFKVGNFEFNALNFDYLVINNSMAQFRGTGKVTGGQSGIGFIMTVVDGQLDGTGVDKLRIKIFNRTTGEVMYDNQPGSSDADLPSRAVGKNSVIVIEGNSKTKSLNSRLPDIAERNQLLVNELRVEPYPNPYRGTFNLYIQSPKAGKMIIEYFTLTGARLRLIEREVKAHESFVLPGTDLKFNGTVVYKVSIGGAFKTGKIIGIE